MAPVLVTLTLLIADVGRAFYYREAVTNAARQAIRVAANPAQQATGNTYCNGSLGTVTKNVPDLTTADAVATIVNTAALEATSDGTTNGSRLDNTAHQTTMTVTWHCNGTSAYTNATATSTDPAVPGSDAISVHLDYTFTMITPLFSALNGGSQLLHITADETGRAEY